MGHPSIGTVEQLLTVMKKHDKRSLASTNGRTSQSSAQSDGNFRVRPQRWNTRCKETNGPLRRPRAQRVDRSRRGNRERSDSGTYAAGNPTDWRYLGTASLAGFIVFFWYNRIANHGTFIATFDAVGLSVFTVTGTVIALNAGLGPTPAALLGMLTGVGGGVLRDITAAEVPLIFRSEIYAVASLFGAIIIIIATQIGFSGVPAEILAAIATFTLRMVSLRRGWRIPIAMPKSTEKG